MTILWIDMQTILHKLSDLGINVLPDGLAEVEYVLCWLRFFQLINPLQNWTGDHEVEYRSNTPDVRLKSYCATFDNFWGEERAAQPTSFIFMADIFLNIKQLDHR